MKPHKIYGIENIEGEALSQFYDAMKQQAREKSWH